MAILLSNELKAVVALENILENAENVQKDKCQTVQCFDYECEMKRNNSDKVDGSSRPVILKFSVRINEGSQAKPYYERLMQNGHFYFSFLFNATFGKFQRLSNYDDGMVVDGFVVQVEEEYDSKKDPHDKSEQVRLDVKLMVRSVTYLGKDKNITSKFIR